MEHAWWLSYLVKLLHDSVAYHSLKMWGGYDHNHWWRKKICHFLTRVKNWVQISVAEIRVVTAHLADDVGILVCTNRFGRSTTVTFHSPLSDIAVVCCRHALSVYKLGEIYSLMQNFRKGRQEENSLISHVPWPPIMFPATTYSARKWWSYEYYTMKLLFLGIIYNEWHVVQIKLLNLGTNDRR